jgi:hypothetical protein
MADVVRDEVSPWFLFSPFDRANVVPASRLWVLSDASASNVHSLCVFNKGIGDVMGLHKCDSIALGS